MCVPSIFIYLPKCKGSLICVSRSQGLVLHLTDCAPLQPFILSATQYPLRLALCNTQCRTDTRFLKEFMVHLVRNVRQIREKNVPLKYNKLKINLFCNNID